MQFDFMGKTTLGMALAATYRRALPGVLPAGAHDVIVCPLQLGPRVKGKPGPVCTATKHCHPTWRRKNADTFPIDRSTDPTGLERGVVTARVRWGCSVQRMSY